jgi:hypothetical protein
LEGRHFYVLTDHRALIGLLQSKLMPPTQRMARLIQKLAGYSFTVGYVRGENLKMANLLSRSFDKENSYSGKEPIAFLEISRDQARNMLMDMEEGSEVNEEDYPPSDLDPMWKYPRPPPKYRPKSSDSESDEENPTPNKRALRQDKVTIDSHKLEKNWSENHLVPHTMLTRSKAREQNIELPEVARVTAPVGPINKQHATLQNTADTEPQIPVDCHEGHTTDVDITTDTRPVNRSSPEPGNRAHPDTNVELRQAGPQPNTDENGRNNESGTSKAFRVEIKELPTQNVTQSEARFLRPRAIKPANMNDPFLAMLPEETRENTDFKQMEMKDGVDLDLVVALR